MYLYNSYHLISRTKHKQSELKDQQINIGKGRRNKNKKIFFLMGIHSMEGWTAFRSHGVTGKIITKRLKHTGNMVKKDLQLKCVC